MDFRTLAPFSACRTLPLLLSVCVATATVVRAQNGARDVCSASEATEVHDLQAMMNEDVICSREFKQLATFPPCNSPDCISVVADVESAFPNCVIDGVNYKSVLRYALVYCKDNVAPDTTSSSEVPGSAAITATDPETDAPSSSSTSARYIVEKDSASEGMAASASTERSGVPTDALLGFFGMTVVMIIIVVIYVVRRRRSKARTDDDSPIAILESVQTPRPGRHASLGPNRHIMSTPASQQERSLFSVEDGIVVSRLPS